MENVQYGQLSSINFNGTLLDKAQPIFNASNRAFRYGDGLFETMRFDQGTVLHLPLHVARLHAGMHLLRLRHLEKIDTFFILEECLKLARACHIHSCARIRFSVFRNDGGYYTPTSDDFSFLVEMETTDETGYRLNDRGWQIALFKELVLPRNAISNLKTINSLPFVCASVFKREKNVDEAFLLNSDGNLVEGASSNIFLVKNNRYYTPALSEGATKGVMRCVLSELIQHQGWSLHEVAVPPDSLLEADEVFVTNTTNGIRWISSFGQQRYFNKAAKALLGLLNLHIQWAQTAHVTL